MILKRCREATIFLFNEKSTLTMEFHYKYIVSWCQSEKLTFKEIQGQASSRYSYSYKKKKKKVVLDSISFFPYVTFKKRMNFLGTV